MARDTHIPWPRSVLNAPEGAAISLAWKNSLEHSLNDRVAFICKTMLGLQPLRETQPQKRKYISPQGSHNIPTNTDKALGTDKPCEGLSNALGSLCAGPVQRRLRRKEQRHPFRACCRECCAGNTARITRCRVHFKVFFSKAFGGAQGIAFLLDSNEAERDRIHRPPILRWRFRAESWNGDLAWNGLGSEIGATGILVRCLGKDNVI